MTNDPIWDEIRAKALQHELNFEGPAGTAAEPHPVAHITNTVTADIWTMGTTPNGKAEACQLCPLYTAPGPVPGSGNPNAHIMLVGEKPGPDEIHAHRAFVGGSGRILSRQCAQVGIKRGIDTFDTNIIRCLTPNLRDPTDDEIRHCAPFLARELAAVRPNVTILLGRIALYAFTGRTGITQQRGQALSAEVNGVPIKVFATFNPAHIMRQQENYPIMCLDLSRAKAQSTFPEIRRRPSEYHVDAKLADYGPYIERRTREGAVLDFDLETTNLDPRTSQIICNGLAVDEDQSFCFRWTPEVAAFFGSLVGLPTTATGGQNIDGFDIPFCEEKGLTFAGPAFDLLQEFHLTNSDQPKNLGHIMSLHTDMEYHKHEAKQNLFLYNCKDVLGGRRARLDVESELKADGQLWRLFQRSVQPLQPILRRMSKTGVRMNLEKRTKWSLAVNMTARQKEKILREAVGVDFSVASPKQVMQLLYDRLGLPVQYRKDQKTKELRPTVDKDAIENLASKFPEHKVLRMIHQIRALDHTRATYIDVALDNDDRAHPRFGTATAATGRLNSWEPNFQNVPTELRELYIPDTPEHVFIAADWSQVETRLAMVLSGDPVGLSILASGQDIIRSITSEAYGIPIESVTEDLRFLGKNIWYGLAYGRGAKDIARQTGKSVTSVEQFINRLYNRFKVWYAWRQDLERRVSRDGALRNSFGRKRSWYSRQITEAFNFPIQSDGADMMYLALIAADSALHNTARLVATVHDDILICAPRDNAKLAYRTLVAVMQQHYPEIIESSADVSLARKYFPEGFSCKVEAHIGNVWSECKKGNKALEQELLG